MSTSKLYENNQKNMYASAMLLISVVLAFFLTKSLYYSNIESKTNLEQLNIQSTDTKKELDELNMVKESIKNDSETRKNIERYASLFREDTIINSIFNKKDGISINDIAIDKWVKLPNWLNMWNISLNIDANNIESLNNYLKYLNSKDNSVWYVIKNVNFPYSSKTNLPFSASVSLWMYYFTK